MEKEPKDLFHIVTKYTNELTEEDKKNYYSIFCDVFNSKEDIENNFMKKYEKNIYGESLIVFCYIEDQCVAIQGFLRNDLKGQMAFQSGDSATLQEYRGKGIFSSLVKAGIETLPKDAVVYGFPNENSLPVFKKLGWSIGTVRKTGLFHGSMEEMIEDIEDDYLSWIMSDHGCTSSGYF